jgi:hypothetical protein
MWESNAETDCKGTDCGDVDLVEADRGRAQYHVAVKRAMNLLVP